MSETFAKKEHNKKKLRKRREKEQRREERKLNNNKGKDFDEMFLYVDANGNFTKTPPSEDDIPEIELKDIQLGAASLEAEDPVKKGFVQHLDDNKGYGFIRENNSGETVFFHVSNVNFEIKRGHKVSFEKERTHKGFSAVNVQLLR